MCIIVSKEKYAKLPSLETLETCFKNNSDGAGFMYTDGDRVIIDKGYMTFKSFKKHYKKLCKKYDDFKDKSLVLHFRIGTSGTNTQKNCHPFPVSSDLTDLQKPYKCTPLGLVHNGIISAYEPSKTEGDKSDTQKFIGEFLGELFQNYKEFYKSGAMREGIENIIKSKMTFLDKNDELYYIGDFINEDGIKYSNSTYKPYRWSYTCKYDYTPSYNKSVTYNFDKNDDIEIYHFEDTTPSQADLIELSPEWYISRSNGNFDKVNSKRYFYDDLLGYLYYETYDGDLRLIDENAEIYDVDYNLLF